MASYPIDILDTGVRCKFCNSKSVIRFGYFKNIQRWWCKDCYRKFAENGAEPRMKVPANQVALAVGMYFEGFGIKEIRARLERTYENYCVGSTIHEWIGKSADKVFNMTRNYLPIPGDRWIVGSTVFRINKSSWYLWDLMDVRTKYFLASSLSRVDNVSYVQEFIRNTIFNVGKSPEVITLADPKFENELIIKFIKDLPGIRSCTEDDIALKNYFCIALQNHARLLCSLENITKAKLITNGWLVHNNYFRLHEDLKNRAPSDLAGIDNKLGYEVLSHFKMIRKTLDDCRE